MPLELLADREGVDSMLGAANIPLRVPSFIDDIVSAMKQMGRHIRNYARDIPITLISRHVCGGYLPQEWKYSTDESSH